MQMLHRVSIAVTCTCFLLCFLPRFCPAQAFEGYTLFCPNNSRTTYLVDMNRTTVHTWSHTKSGGYSCYLLEDGSLLRSAVAPNPQLNAGGAMGTVQRISWNGALIWEYTYSSSTYRAHHDICPMPNGNVILIAWEVKTPSQAVQAGLRRTTQIWPDHLVEIQPAGANGGNIVWEWHAWDHLIQDYDPSKSNYGVVADHPELFNINMGSTGIGPMGGDWMHINGISYNPGLDQIAITSHTLDEVYVIDHGTTTAEAASHSGGRRGRGGDILYRWGMPSNYGAPGAQYFDVVHCPSWIPAGLPGEGHLLAFNNGERRRRSEVVELVPPLDGDGNYSRAAGQAFGPASPVWSYTSDDFFSVHLGGVQRLPNGNTLMVESTSGNLFECDASGTVVWSYFRGGEIVRALRYSPDYPGVSALRTSGAGAVPDDAARLRVWNTPNPFTGSTIIRYTLPARVDVDITVTDRIGRTVTAFTRFAQSAGDHYIAWNGTDASGASLPSGMYYARVRAGNTATMHSIVLLRE